MFEIFIEYLLCRENFYFYADIIFNDEKLENNVIIVIIIVRSGNFIAKPWTIEKSIAASGRAASWTGVIAAATACGVKNTCAAKHAAILGSVGEGIDLAIDRSVGWGLG